MGLLDELKEKSTSHELFVLKPGPGVLILLGALISFGPIISLFIFVLGGGQVYGLIILVGALIIWASVATIRIKLFADRLETTVFWRTSWNVSLAQVSLSEGVGGDVPFIPAIIVKDRRTGEKIGEILTPQFRARDLLALEEELAALGLQIDRRRR